MDDPLATEQKYQKLIAKEKKKQQEAHQKIVEQRTIPRTRLFNQLRAKAGFPDWQDKWVFKNLIAGPISLTYHPDVFGRQFFIFGDRHETKTGYCPPDKSIDVLDFLDFMFKDISVLKDFFLEYNYQQKQTIDTHFPKAEGHLTTFLNKKNLSPKQEKDALGGLWNQYGPCLIENKNPCLLVYPATRFHYVDVRGQTLRVKGSVHETLDSFHMSYLNALTYLSFYNGLQSTIHKTDNWTDMEEIFNQIDQLSQLMPLETFITDLKNYFKVDHNSLKFGNIEQLVTGIYDFPKQFRTYEQFEPNGHNRLRKQFRSIYDHKIKQALLNYTRDEITKFYQQYSQIRYKLNKLYPQHAKLPTYSIWNFIEPDKHSLKNNWGKDRPDLKRYLYQLLDPFISFLKHKTTLLSNIFLLSMDFYTICRIFKDNLQNSQQVWLYLGNIHSDNIRRFITDYLKIETMVSSNQVDERCIDITPVQTKIVQDR